MVISMTSQLIFTGIVIVVIVQRLFELRLSKRNEEKLLAQGGRSHHDNSLFWVKTLQVAWFTAMLIEVWVLDRPFIWGLGAIALLALLIGQSLRYLSMQALASRWTLPIMTLPETKAVDTGIYDGLRHPNWLGVILEIAALPLIHSAYLSSICFSIANALLLTKRIRAEEEALNLDNHYNALFADKPHFLLKPNSLTPLFLNTRTSHGS
jgi:methyltransferase